MAQEDLVYVPIPARLYSEFILRRGEHVNVAAYVESVVTNFLERTRGDAGIWSEAHAEQVADEEEIQFPHGDPHNGFQWLSLFLPNGTKVRVSYKGRNHYAIVENEQVVYEGENLSPSELASKVANGTSRNAWRDLWLQFPGTSDWKLADVLRKGGAETRP